MVQSYTKHLWAMCLASFSFLSFLFFSLPCFSFLCFPLLCFPSLLPAKRFSSSSSSGFRFFSLYPARIALTDLPADLPGRRHSTLLDQGVDVFRYYLTPLPKLQWRLFLLCGADSTSLDIACPSSTTITSPLSFFRVAYSLSQRRSCGDICTWWRLDIPPFITYPGAAHVRLGNGTLLILVRRPFRGHATLSCG